MKQKSDEKRKRIIAALGILSPCVIKFVEIIHSSDSNMSGEKSELYSLLGMKRLNYIKTVF